MKRYIQAINKKLRTARQGHTTAVLVVFAVLLVSLSLTGHAAALFILTGVEDTAIVLDGTVKIPETAPAMLDLSVKAGKEDIPLADGQEVLIHRGREVITATSEKETVSKLLSRMGVKLSPLEMAAVDVSGDRVEITVDEEIVYYDRVEEVTPYKTVRVANPDLTEGTERVTQEGRNGAGINIYEVIWSNGRQVSRQLVDQLENSAVDRIVEYGTAPAGPEPASKIVKNADGSGTLYFASGKTLKFSAAKSMKATAYTTGYDGVGTITYTGTVVKEGVVAVDKKVIPLGSKVYIATNDGTLYGVYSVEDTGVKGNKVDIFMDTYKECIQFGRRGCTVYILED